MSRMHTLAMLGVTVALLLLHLGTFQNISTHALGHHSGDLLGMHLPIWDWAQRTLGGGDLPLWNPHILCGYPQWASGELSLTTLLGPLLLLPLASAISLWWIATQVLTALFAMRWLRALRLSPLTCLLGGTTAALCSAVTHRIPAGHPNIPACFPWIFLLLSTWTLWWRTGRRHHLLAGAVAWALLLLSSHLQIAYQMVLWFGTVAIITSVNTKPGWLKRLIGGMATIAIPGTLAAAVLWLPQMEFALVSERGAFDVFHASMVSFPAESLLTLLIPGCYGAGLTDPISSDPSPFVGRWMFFWETSLFLGPLVIASLLLRWSRRHGRVELALWISTILFTLIALGRQTPLFQFALDWIPGMSFLRGPAKFMNPVLFSLIVLGAIRFDRFVRHPPHLIRPTLSARKIIAIAMCLICFATLFLTLFAESAFQPLADLPLNADALEQFPESEFDTTGTIANQLPAAERLRIFTDATSLAMSGWIALGFAGLIASLLPMRRRLMAGILVGINLIICGMWALPNLTRVETSAVAYPEPVTAWLQENTRGARTLWLGRNFRNLGARHDISAVNGNCSTLGQRQADLFRLAFRHPPGTLENDALVYELAVPPKHLGVGVYATIDPEVNSPSEAVSIGAHRLWSATNIADPMVMMGFSTRLVDGPEEARQVLIQDPSSVVIESTTRVEAALGLGSLIRESPGEITVLPSYHGSGWVIILESLLPGWRATAGDEAREILPAQIAFMAVPVQEDEREITLRYQPATFRLGLFLSLVCFGLFAGAALQNKKGSPVGLPSKSD